MYVLEIVVCPFVLFVLAIVLSVLLRYTDSDYPFVFYLLSIEDGVSLTPLKHTYKTKDRVSLTPLKHTYKTKDRVSLTPLKHTYKTKDGVSLTPLKHT
jgi:hypothetical protein